MGWKVPKALQIILKLNYLVSGILRAVGHKQLYGLRLLVKEAVQGPGKRETSRFCKKTCFQVAFKKLDIDGDGEV